MQLDDFYSITLNWIMVVLSAIVCVDEVATFGRDLFNVIECHGWNDYVVLIYQDFYQTARYYYVVVRWSTGKLFNLMM